MNWDTLQAIWSTYIWAPLTTLKDDWWHHLIDAVLLTVLLCGMYYFIRGRRAGKMLIGLLAVFALYGISWLFDLTALHMVLSTVVTWGLPIFVIVFHPEIRDALEKTGTKLSGFRLVKSNDSERAHVTEEIVSAVAAIAQNERDGALIVIERNTGLGEYIDKGYKLDAEVSEKLLRNIFIDKSPLHDGAVIISQNRIAAACCKLPLSNNESVVANYGTRHRAAVGISEKSDCVVVVVSEERHVISVMCNGLIKRDYNLGMVDGNLDMRDEEVSKKAQKALWEDLYKLIVGKTENPKRKKRKDNKATDEADASSEA